MLAAFPAFLTSVQFWYQLALMRLYFSAPASASLDLSFCRFTSIMVCMFCFSILTVEGLTPITQPAIRERSERNSEREG